MKGNIDITASRQVAIPGYEQRFEPMKVRLAAALHDSGA